MSSKKTQFVVMSNWHSEVEPDGTVEDLEPTYQKLHLVSNNLDDVIKSIAELFHQHEVDCDNGTNTERLSSATIFTLQIPGGINVSFYEATGSVHQLGLAIKKALRAELKKTVKAA